MRLFEVLQLLETNANSRATFPKKPSLLGARERERQRSCVVQRPVPE